MQEVNREELDLVERNPKQANHCRIMHDINQIQKDVRFIMKQKQLKDQTEVTFPHQPNLNEKSKRLNKKLQGTKIYDRQKSWMEKKQIKLEELRETQRLEKEKEILEQTKQFRGGKEGPSFVKEYIQGERKVGEMFIRAAVDREMKQSNNQNII